MASKFRDLPSNINDFSCTACDYKAITARVLWRHFRTAHEKTKDLNCRCIYSEQCFRKSTFKTFYALDKHLRTYHPRFFEDSSDASAEGARQGNSGPVEPLMQSVLDEGPNIHTDPAPEQAASCDANTSANVDFEGDSSIAESIYELCTVTNETEGSLELMGAEFLLALLSDDKLTQVAAQSVMRGANGLTRKAVEAFVNEIQTQLEQTNECDHGELMDDMRSKARNLNLFAGLHSQYSQIAFFKKHFKLVMPQKITLQVRPEDYGRFRTRQNQSFRAQSYVIVPMLPQLELMLNMKDVYDRVKKRHVSTPGVWSRYEDGLNFKNCDLFKEHPDGLQIHLYLDEVQLCNSIGSYNHKIVFVYFSLGNIDPKFRSSYQHVHLLAMFYHDQVTDFTLNQLLKPIISELKLLEQGVEFDIGGKKETFWGTLTAVIADNLGSHQVGGYKTAFSNGFRRCRSCLGTPDEIQSKFSDSEFIARNKEDYEQHIQCLTFEELRAHFSWLFGINEDSVLNELKHFHVTLGLAPDLMHDLLEGVIPLVVCRILNHCLKQRYFTLDELNHLILNFNYGHADSRDKPSLIKSEHLARNKLRQSATQLWLLATHLPLMVGTRVPDSDNKWRCLSLILEISRLAFLESISGYELLKLGSHVEEFLRSYKSSFNVKGIIPKMHHLVHYPRWIRHLGPLIALWCMRYEAKHAYFKRLQKAIGNFTNPLWTLSIRHQVWACKKFRDARGLFLKLHIMGSKSQRMSLFHCPYGGLLAQFFNLPNLCNSVNRLTWLKINSISFRVGESVVVCKLNGHSHFGLVENIVVRERTPFFVCKMFQAVKFDSHLQAYHVRARDFFLIVSPSNLVHFYAHTLHIPGFVRENGVDFYVIVKSDVPNILCSEEKHWF